MKQITFLLALLLLSVAGMAQVKFTSMTFDEAKKKAQDAGKEILVDVVNGQKSNPDVAKYFKKNNELAAFINKNFIAARIQATACQNEELTDKLYSLIMPCVVFFSNQGEQLAATNWPTVLTGKADLNVLAQEALTKAGEKRTNTRKIDFRELGYKAALEAAKSEGKLLFVDNHIPGCRPCKLMEVDVFTLDSVADFYNKNFVSIQLDATTDPEQVAKNNGVRGFPGYLFFDAEGDLLYQSGGFMPSQQFIAKGQQALDTYNKNQEIDFRKIDLDQAKALAKVEHKMIFVDLSATWCGPCKQLKKTTFKAPVVARFMNKNFVSVFVECDIEKETAAQLKELYGYAAYPTMLFLNAEGELLHKLVGGGMSNQEFIAEAQKALDGKGLTSYQKRYNSGERDPQFMKEYIQVLGDSYESKLAQEVTALYLDGFEAEKLLETANFKILTDNVKDIDAAPAQLFLTNFAKFEAAFDAKATNYRLRLWHTLGRSFAKRGDTPTFDKTGYAAFVKRVGSSDLTSEMKNEILTASKYNNAEVMGDWKTYVEMAVAEMKQQGANANLFVIFNQGLRVERMCKDKALRTKFAQGLRSTLQAREKAQLNDPKEEQVIKSINESIDKLDQ